MISKESKGRDNQDKWYDLWYIFIPYKFEKTLAEFDINDIEFYAKIMEDSCIKKFGRWYEFR